MKRLSTTNNPAVVRNGFSLIELLIVLAILVLLASLVAPRLLGSREKANVDAAKTQISLFKSTLEIYSLHNSGYPTSEQGLKALIERPSSDSGIGGGDEFEDDAFGEDEDLADLGLDEEDDGMEEEEGSSNSNWQGPYIKSDKLPKDPWGSAYRYEYPGQNNKIGEPDIWSLGPDRKDNTTDDVVSWTGKRKTGEGGSGADGFEVGGGDDSNEEIDLSRE
jgi:general secretion pathway protein G